MNARELKQLGGAAPSVRDRSREAANRFSAAAEAAGLLDVAVGTVDSPVGPLLVAVTPRGVVRIAFAGERRSRVLEDLAREISPRVLESASATDEVRRELDEYFSGRRERFDLRLDRRLIHGLARDVLTTTSRIPFGETATYGEIARKIGHPNAARAVGNALGSNPIPVVIPCHRVLRAGGALGGYGGGVKRKEKLLDLEQAGGLQLKLGR